VIDVVASDLLGSRWFVAVWQLAGFFAFLPEVRFHVRYHDLPRTPDGIRPLRVSSSRRSPPWDLVSRGPGVVRISHIDKQRILIRVRD
jgi:hypothetical protein